MLYNQQKSFVTYCFQLNGVSFNIIMTVSLEKLSPIHLKKKNVHKFPQLWITSSGIC